MSDDFKGILEAEMHRREHPSADDLRCGGDDAVASGDPDMRAIEQEVSERRAMHVDAVRREAPREGLRALAQREFVSATGAVDKAPPGEGAGATKYDAEKPRWDLLPLDAVAEIVKVMSYGARKYAANGWRSVPNATARYTAALLRHIERAQSGEARDPDTGLSHLAHAACNAVFLVWLELHPAPATHE